MYLFIGPGKSSPCSRCRWVSGALTSCWVLLRSPRNVLADLEAGAHGVFTSYGDWSNITAASFLSGAGKQTPTFVGFSTVAGSRGSPDTVRDVHGFATRFYTDAGNFGETAIRDPRRANLF